MNKEEWLQYQGSVDYLEEMMTVGDVTLKLEKIVTQSKRGLIASSDIKYLLRELLKEMGDE